MTRQTFHYYQGSRRLVSVTEALRMAGCVDFSGIPLEVLEAARDRGVQVHQWVASLNQGEDAPPPAGAEPYCEAFRRFLRETGFAVLGSEEALAHPTAGFAGTLDLRGRMSRVDWVLDLKATAAIPEEAPLQTAAYAELLRVHDRAVGARGVLHLRADGTWRLERHQDEGDLHDFLACLRVAYWRLRHGLSYLEG